jgi:hypothetical protein
MEKTNGEEEINHKEHIEHKKLSRAHYYVTFVLSAVK